MSETNTSPNSRLAILSLAAVAVVSVVAGLWLSHWWQQREQAVPTELEATVLPEGRALTPFALVDHNSQAFGLERLQGKWSFLFFGYVHCPDVCPLALSVLAGAYKQLANTPEMLENVEFVFVSVDPDRDTPEQLREYVGYFNPEFVGVTGPADEIDKLTGQLGILYGFEDKEPGVENYLVNHSAQFILIDPQGRFRAVFSPPHDATAISTSFIKIRKHFGS